MDKVRENIEETLLKELHVIEDNLLPKLEEAEEAAIKCREGIWNVKGLTDILKKLDTTPVTDQLDIIQNELFLVRKRQKLINVQLDQLESDQENDPTNSRD